MNLLAWQETPYTIPLMVLAGISIGSALYIWWRRRDVPGVTMGALLLIASAEWVLCYALELGSVTLPTKIFWAKMEVLGTVAIPVIFLAFALQYTGREKRLNPRSLTLLSLVPLITLMLAFTNEAHGLIWSQLALGTAGPYTVLERADNVGSWFFLVYMNVLLVIATALLIQTLYRARQFFQWQAILLLLTAVVPWVGSILIMLGLNPFPYLNPIPLAVTITSLAVTWSLDRLRVGDLVPLARGSVIGSMSDCVIVVDAQDRIVDLNPAAQDLIGQTIAKALAQPIERVWPDWSSLTAPDGTGVAREVTLGEGGQQRNYDVRISPLTDWRGQLISRVIVLRDITERKQAEEALRDSEARLRTVVSNAPIILFALDQQGTFTFVAGSGLDALGRSPDTFVGHSIFDAAPTMPQILEAARHALAGETSTLIIEVNGLTFECRFAPVLDQHSQVTGVIGVATDITERKQVEALERAKEAALAASRAKSTFLANMSHELRTPLSAIIGYSELLQEEAEDQGYSDLIPDLEKIRTASDQLLSIINNILDLSKIEAGKAELHLETIDLTTMIEDVVTTVRHLIEKNDDVLQLDYPEDLGSMYADLTRVRQILLNLLSNAAKFTQQGRITFTVTRDTAFDGTERVCFRVADTGIGMTPEQLQKLFRPFSQADTSIARKYGGTGLGLALSSRYCWMMGGEINVESEFERGSTFTVHLPVKVTELKAEYISQVQEGSA